MRLFRSSGHNSATRWGHRSALPKGRVERGERLALITAPARARLWPVRLLAALAMPTRAA